MTFAGEICLLDCFVLFWVSNRGRANLDLSENSKAELSQVNQSLEEPYPLLGIREDRQLLLLENSVMLLTSNRLRLCVYLAWTCLSD